MTFRWRWLLGGGYLLLIVLIVLYTFSPCPQEPFSCLGRVLPLLLLVLPWTLPILADVQIPWLYPLGLYLGVGLNFAILYRIGTAIDRDGIAGPAFRWLVRSVGVGLAIVIAIFGILIPLRKKYESAQSRRQQLKEIQGLGVRLYAPTFLPSGYLLTADPNTTMPYANTDYYELAYSYGPKDVRDPLLFTIYQFKRPAEYHPPEHCGELVPMSKGEIKRPCQLVDESSEGDKIYYSEEWLPGSHGWFMAKGDVLVTLAARTTTENVDRGVFIHVLRSLQEASPEHLVAMKDSLMKGALKVP